MEQIYHTPLHQSITSHYADKQTINLCLINALPCSVENFKGDIQFTLSS